jgi:hypothetical protein
MQSVQVRSQGQCRHVPFWADYSDFDQMEPAQLEASDSTGQAGSPLTVMTRTKYTGAANPIACGAACVRSLRVEGSKTLAVNRQYTRTSFQRTK